MQANALRYELRCGDRTGYDRARLSYAASISIAQNRRVALSECSTSLLMILNRWPANRMKYWCNHVPEFSRRISDFIASDGISECDIELLSQEVVVYTI